MSAKGKILFITGAGVSKDSGIPTFRGEDGYYLARDPISVEKFKSDPEAVWQEIAERREIIAQASPNDVHQKLVEIEKELQERFLCVTQNIDGLHRKAGSERLLEVHGNVWQLKEIDTTKENEFLEMLQLKNYEHMGYSKLEYLLEASNSDFSHVITQEVGDNSQPNGYRPNITFLGESLGHRLVALKEFLRSEVEKVIVLGSSMTISTAPMIAQEVKYHYPDCELINVDPYPNKDVNGFTHLEMTASEYLKNLSLS